MATLMVLGMLILLAKTFVRAGRNASEDGYVGAAFLLRVGGVALAATLFFGLLPLLKWVDTPF